MKHTFLLFLLFSATTYVFCQVGEDKSKYETALESYQSGNYGLTISYCSDILNLSGQGNRDAFRLRALANKAIGEYKLAANDYTEALKGKGDPSVYYERGLVYMCQRKFKEAEADFSNASRLYKQQATSGGNDFFVYQEEFGRASHYNEKYRLAINSFTDAIQNGSTSAYIDMMSSLFQNKNFTELKFYSDSLIGAGNFTPLTDKLLQHYIHVLNQIANDEITETTLQKIDYAIKHHLPIANKCFQGFYNDLLYARAVVLEGLGKDTLAYRQYKSLYALNDAWYEVKKKTESLKTSLAIDATPPTIVMRNPEMNDQNSITIQAVSNKMEVFVQVVDAGLRVRQVRK